MDYIEDIKIDIYNLEKEWQSHPSKVVQYGDLWADQTKIKEIQQEKCDRLKEELKEERARLENHLRYKWKDYDFPKLPAAGSTESWCITQESYKAKQKELYEAKEVLIEESVKERKLKTAYYAFSINHKESLENETRLFLNGYFSELKEEDSETNHGMKPRSK